MLKSVVGIYRDGKIELAEDPDDVPEDTRVIVTFLQSSAVDLRERSISAAQAADLRARLSTFAGDWERPEMDLYDDYDAAKAEH
jgi:hypothetical protein